MKTLPDVLAQPKKKGSLGGFQNVTSKTIQPAFLATYLKKGCFWGLIQATQRGAPIRWGSGYKRSESKECQCGGGGGGILQEKKALGGRCFENKDVLKMTVSKKEDAL